MKEELITVELEYLMPYLSYIIQPILLGWNDIGKIPLKLKSTLVLVVKKLYDTGGTSINFFKPLATNLYVD